MSDTCLMLHQWNELLYKIIIFIDPLNQAIVYKFCPIDLFHFAKADPLALILLLYKTFQYLYTFEENNT